MLREKRMRRAAELPFPHTSAAQRVRFGHGQSIRLWKSSPNVGMRSQSIHVVVDTDKRTARRPWWASSLITIFAYPRPLPNQDAFFPMLLHVVFARELLVAFWTYIFLHALVNPGVAARMAAGA